jgi:hypothetical protein
LNPLYRTKWFKEGLRLIGIDQKTAQEGLDRAQQIWIQFHGIKLTEEQSARSKEVNAQDKKRRRTTRHLRSNPTPSIHELNEKIFGDWNTNDTGEYEDYIVQSRLEWKQGFSPLAWWCEESQRMKWPHLSSLAITMLSIPAMSAEAERVFSGARRTIPWDRALLLPATIEVLECLKSTFRSKELPKEKPKEKPK